MEDDAEVQPPDQIGNYQILEVLGQGAFATVFRARHRITGWVVALKAIPKRRVQTMVEFELLQREVNLMKILDHPFIAALFEVLDDEENFYLAIELVENGNLLDYINSNRGLNEQQASRIFAQLGSVLDYLHHEKRVVHRDLKAENVLLDSSNNIRVVDFGLSRAFTKGNPFLQTTCGSPAYVSPEIIKEEPYTAAADVWSSGVLLYAMVCGQLPFDGDNLSLMLQAILTANPIIPAQLSIELRSLLVRLLMKEPKARITVRGLLEHPWVSGYNYQAIVSTLKVQDAAVLDDAVLGEMRLLGYETGGLLQELKSYTFNERTSAYKMLRRKRICEEIGNLTKQRRDKRAQAIAPSRQPLPVLAPDQKEDMKANGGPVASSLPRLATGEKVRKRHVRSSVGPAPPAVPNR
jgi:serine/threonine protein kinase